MTRRDFLALAIFLALACALIAPFHFSDRAFFPAHSAALAPESFFAPDWVKDEPNNPNVGDKHTIIYPDFIETRRQFAAGRHPLWNPNNFAGIPHQANPLTATYYPPNWILLSVDPILAMALSMAMHLALGAFFFYRFARVLGLTDIACYAGALAFAFSGWMAVHLHHNFFVNTMIWLPLALASIEGLCRRLNAASGFSLAIAVGMMWLAGFPQTAVINCYLLAAYALFRLAAGLRERGLKRQAKVGGCLAAFVACGLFLAAIQLGPTLEFMRTTGHQDTSLEVLKENALRPISLVHLLVPDFFGNPVDQEVAQENLWFFWLLTDAGADANPSNNYSERSFFPGLIVLILALTSLFLSRPGRSWFWLIASLLALSMALGTRSLDYAVHLPGLNFGSPMRFTQIFALSMPLLFALGLHGVLQSELSSWGWKALKLALAIIAFILGAVVAVMWFQFSWATEFVTDRLIAAGVDKTLGTAEMPIAEQYQQMAPHLESLRRALTQATVFYLLAFVAMLCLISKKVPKPLALGLILVALLAELLYYGGRYNQPVQKTGMFESHSPGLDFLAENLAGERFLRWDPQTTQGFMSPNTPLALGLKDAQGYRSLTPASFLDFMRSVEPNSYDIGYANLGQIESLTSHQLDLLGIRFVVSQNPIPDCPLAQVYPEKNAPAEMYIYRNEGLLGRAFIRRKTKLSAAVERLEDFAQAKNAPENPFAQTVWLDSLPADFELIDVPPLRPDQVEVTCDEAGRLEFSIDVESNGLLIVNEQFDPGWQATHLRVDKDARPLKVIAANHCFMAIPVGPDVKKVRLEYNPKSFRIGGLISILALLAMLGVAFMWRPKELTQAAALNAEPDENSAGV